jgi:hypothetical protein
MLILLFALTQLAAAADHSHEAMLATPVDHAAPAALTAKAGRVSVAMNAEKGTPVYAGEIFSVGKQAVKLVDKLNAKIELAPYSVAEFSENGDFKLMRGSALVEARGERTLRTSTASLDFNGRVLLSYDHKEKSTSAFVLDGEARMLNPAEEGSSLRLERYRGATLEMGGILPQLIRQLDLGSLNAWMKGYAWPEDRSQEILKHLPAAMTVADKSAPTHLEEAKIEDYFSSIDTEDDSDSQPDYYERKFADPDAVVAEAKSKKSSAAKSISPEEAALITLPSTKIDLGFEVIGSPEKAAELNRLGKKHAPTPKRSIASVKPKAVRVERQEEANSEDREVNEVLQRLRGIEPRKPVVSGVPAHGSRFPASINPSVVPDPVYDLSENF